MLNQPRPSVFETVQIGVEATPGTAVPALIRLQGTDIKPKPVPKIKPVRAAGNKFNTASVAGREYTEAPVSGDQSFTDLCFLFNMNICKGVASLPNGNGTLTVRRTYTPHPYLPEVFTTLTVQRGNALQGGKQFPYGIMPDMTQTWAEDECKVSGTMWGRKLDKGVPMSGDAIQTIHVTGVPTTGTFTLAHGADTSAVIAFTATAATVQAAVAALASVGAGNVMVTPYLPDAETGKLLQAPANTALNAAGAVFYIQFIGAMSEMVVTTLVAADTFDTGDVAVAVLQVGAAVTVLPQIVVPPLSVGVFIGKALNTLVQLNNLNAAEAMMNQREVLQNVIDNRNLSFRQPIEKAPTFTGSITVDDDSDAVAYLESLRTGETLYLQIVAQSEEIIETIANVNYHHNYVQTYAIRFDTSEDGTTNEYETSKFAWFGVNDAALGGAFSATIDTNIAANVL